MTPHAATDAPDTITTPAAQRCWTVADAVSESRPVTLISAAVVALIVTALAVGTHVPWPTAVVAVALLPVVLVDIVDHRLPNRMVAGAAVAGVTAMVIDIAAGGEVRLAAVALGAAAMAAPLLVAHLISPASMGFGDVKFAAVLGAAVGLVHPTASLVALAAGSLLASIHGLVMRQRVMAFGPALLLGAVLVLGAHGTDLITFADTSAALSAGRTR